jgi:hypothetical protein
MHQIPGIKGQPRSEACGPDHIPQLVTGGCPEIYLKVSCAPMIESPFMSNVGSGFSRSCLSVVLYSKIHFSVCTAAQDSRLSVVKIHFSVCTAKFCQSQSVRVINHEPAFGGA